MKQTAVEWLVKEIPNMHWEDPYWADLFERAKEMEKEQTCHFGARCCVKMLDKKEWTLEEYYNETFKQQ